MEEKRNGQKTLPSFSPGSVVTISELCAGPSARCRVCALGLTPGTEVEILSSGQGPCRVRVRGTDMVLGNQLAEKILAFKQSIG